MIICYSIVFCSTDHPLGVWIPNAPYMLMRNKKNTFNLSFDGYEYVKEGTFKNLTNWICAHNANASSKKCRARCSVRPDENSIRLNTVKHNHARTNK